MTITKSNSKLSTPEDDQQAAAQRLRRRAIDAQSPVKLFGLELLRLRERRGWTMTDAAARVGITLGMLNNLEKGNRFTSVEVVLKLATVYRASPAKLLSLLRRAQDALLAQKHAEALRIWKRERGQQRFEFEEE